MYVIREATKKDRANYNRVAKHPLQSWEWSEFRQKTGVEVSRLIEEENKKIVRVYQITWHRIPGTKLFIGYCPKSAIPECSAVEEINKIAAAKGAIFVKFEPNEKLDGNSIGKIDNLKKKFNWLKGKSLFTKYSFWLDISKNEEELLKNMHQKTRYNLRLAEKKGVKIIEDSSEDGFDDYWKLMEETTARQGFYAHTRSYHRKMWQTMVQSGTGSLMKAVYEGKVLTTWVLFRLNDILYYPYGASSNEHREVMASNLMMWEAIKYGKKHGCRLFDMWGSLGPDPDTRDPWYGFHRFKQGYGPELVEFIGTFDLVTNRSLYHIYNVLDKLRWTGLKLLASVKRK